MKRSFIECRAEVYGILSFWIMAFHLNMYLSPLLGSVYLGRAATIGACCVDVFLFISGYCIYHSWTRNPNFRAFLAKRVKRVVVPYLLIAAPYFIWKFFAFYGDQPLLARASGFIYNMSGLSFLVSGELDTWFPIAIMIFYLISPLLIKLLEGEKGKWTFILLLLTVIAIIRWVPYFSRTCIMWGRLPSYACGILLAIHDKSKNADKTAKRGKVLNAVKLLLSLSCLVVLTITPLFSAIQSAIGSDLFTLFYLVLIPPVLFLVEKLVQVLPGFLYRLFRFCGNVSLEIYLIHLLLIYVVSYYGWSAWLLPVALLLSIPLAFLVSVITKMITAYSIQHT